MITCPNCSTLNPEGEAGCLACRTPLATAGAVPSPEAGGKCANGHPIDPSWTSCPYCTRAQPAGAPKKTKLEVAAGGQPFAAAGGSQPTRLENAVAGTPPPAAPPPIPGGARTTRLEEGPGVAPHPGQPMGGRRTRLEGEATGSAIPGGHPAGPPPPLPVAPGGARPTRLEEVGGGRRHTVLHESAPAPYAGGQAREQAPAPVRQAPPVTGSGLGSDRRLVAVLAAPGSGEVFPVKAGKNLIGAGAACEICLRHDSEVSGEHALILYRGEVFYLTDKMSTNGTWINGEDVDPTRNSIVLEDRDRIRCGATELIFLMLDGEARRGQGA